MKNITVFLDPAHGKGVLGKQSPDGTHKEYIWSRERCKNIKALLEAKGYTVYLTTTSEEEIGLSKRVSFVENTKVTNTKVFLSLHNDASRSDGKWGTAKGPSVWTTRGVTKSDYVADVIIEKFWALFPEVKKRFFAPGKLEKDFESNFTVLMGNYVAVLVEWLFQDNQEDLAMLKDANMNARFEEAIVEAVESINTFFAA